MQRIKLSTVPGVVNAGINLSQYDVGREIAFDLYDYNGPHTVGTTDVITLRATKPSGFSFDVTATTTSSNTVVFEVSDTMSNESGSFPAELRITNGSDILGTANFLWNVERAPKQEGTVDGNTEAQNLMSAIMAAISDAEQAAADARDAGMSDDIKQALLNCFAHVAWIDDQGQAYYDALRDALYPPIPATAITLNKSTLKRITLNSTETLTATVTPADTTDSVVWTSSDPTVASVDQTGTVTAVAYGSATITAKAGSVTATCSCAVVSLSSISAVFTQGTHTVYSDDTLDSLKPYLVVTATYSDSSTAVVPDSDYTLSGTLTVGTSTITVTYGEETDTFTVTVTQAVPHYAIVNNLTHTSSSNAGTTTVDEGDSYTTSIGVEIGYTLDSVTVTMGGVDITSSVYNSGTQQIVISSVTGNVVITAIAIMTPSSISAVFTQGGATIYDTDTLDSLKQYLVVTATYPDSSTETVPSTDYTLSGTLAEGTSTITCSYAGKTDTFTVTVSSLLPSGYTQKAWISTYCAGGGQTTYAYITVPADDVLELQYKMIVNGGGGNMYQAGGTTTCIAFYNGGVYYDLNSARAGFLSQTLNAVNTIRIGNHYVEDVDSGAKKTNTTQTGLSDLNWRLGNNNYETSQGQQMIYIKQYHNGTLVRHMLPCVRDQDSLAGFYDIVQSEFIYGTKSYTTGDTI